MSGWTGGYNGGNPYANPYSNNNGQAQAGPSYPINNNMNMGYQSNAAPYDPYSGQETCEASLSLISFPVPSVSREIK